jgi:hypothetical protein
MREPSRTTTKGEETTPEPSLFQITSYVARQMRAALEADLRPMLSAAWQLDAIRARNPAHRWLKQLAQKGGAQ